VLDFFYFCQILQVLDLDISGCSYNRVLLCPRNSWRHY